MVEYIIPIKGLSLGSHCYTYKIDDPFFANFENLDADKGLLNLVVDLMVESNLLNIRFYFTGYIELQCDRCLDKFNLNVENSFRLIVKYGEQFEEISEEVIVIPSSESNIDLGQFIYEYVNLMLPIKKAHANDAIGNEKCNAEMINQLNKYSEQKSDLRWDALKNINIE
ncbi:MAG: hypothetical protein CL661_02725 [Bacteroidetes bacterium]|jgi:uncharacterized metal-binding protein YceD (DUF177 family)|nr:hypothetical protein [Bacteroidota bacterium]|tara:strand:- start:1237 stop:1743 length:507 start_codon:yes stop_codon:yes gene_type:complete